VINVGKGFRWIAGIILLLIVASLPIFAADSPIIIRIREGVTVNAGPVHLADIATICEASVDDQRLLSEIDLGKAPTAGQSRCMTRQYIQFKLAQAGYKKDRVQLEMPDQIQVTGAGIQLNAEMMQKLVEDAIRCQAPKRWTSWRVAFSGKFNSRWVPPGALTAAIEDGSDPLAPGVNLLQIKVFSDGKPVLRMAMAIRIEATGRVAVLQTDLPKHSQLLASAVSWEERLLKGGEALTLAADGLRTTRRLRKGEVIDRMDVETAPLVHKGEKVQVIYRSAGAAVMVYGTARTDGWLGQTIHVENIDSKKAISGIVVAEGRVEVK
jgi:flagella basal body P-ring formation protein FlgA